MQKPRVYRGFANEGTRTTTMLFWKLLLLPTGRQRVAGGDRAPEGFSPGRARRRRVGAVLPASGRLQNLRQPHTTFCRHRACECDSSGVAGRARAGAVLGRARRGGSA